MTLVLEQNKEPMLIVGKKTEKILVIWIDGGGRIAELTVYNSGTKEITLISRKDFLKLPTKKEFNGVQFSDYDRVIFGSEMAHLTPQNGESDAQIYTDEELATLLKNISDNGHELIATSAKQFPSVLASYKGKKDVDDTAAWAEFLLRTNSFDNQKKIRTKDDFFPSKTVKIAIEWRRGVTNKDMNRAQKRNFGLPKKDGVYQDLDSCTVMRDLILPNIDWMLETFPKRLIRFFNLDGMTLTPKKILKPISQTKILANYPDVRPDISQYRHLIQVVKRTSGKIEAVDWIPDFRALYAVFNGLFDYHGKVRLDPRDWVPSGTIVSNNFLHDHYFVDKQFHGLGGVPRAALYYYAFPRYVAESWYEINGADGVDWKKCTTTYIDENNNNRRYNSGHLTDEQRDFLREKRSEIRKMNRDYIINPFRRKVLG